MNKPVRERFTSWESPLSRMQTSMATFRELSDIINRSKLGIDIFNLFELYSGSKFRVFHRSDKWPSPHGQSLYCAVKWQLHGSSNNLVHTELVAFQNTATMLLLLFCCLLVSLLRHYYINKVSMLHLILHMILQDREEMHYNHRLQLPAKKYEGYV
jgi:hypothetical protein